MAGWLGRTAGRGPGSRQLQESRPPWAPELQGAASRPASPPPPSPPHTRGLGQGRSILPGGRLVREAGGWGATSGPVQGWGATGACGPNAHAERWDVGSLCARHGALVVTPPLGEDTALQGQAAGLLEMVPGCEVSPAGWAKNGHLPEQTGAHVIISVGVQPRLPAPRLQKTLLTVWRLLQQQVLPRQEVGRCQDSPRARLRRRAVSPGAMGTPASSGLWVPPS